MAWATVIAAGLLETVYSGKPSSNSPIARSALRFLRICAASFGSLPASPMGLLDNRHLRFASIGCAVCIAASPWVWLALVWYRSMTIF